MLDKRAVTYIIIATLLIILLNIITLHFGYNDSFEYITNSRFITDDNPLTSIRCSHTCTYPFFQSFFTNISDSLFMLKAINVIWLLINILILYKITKKPKTLLLATTSPIIWYMSTSISPTIITSTLLLLSYHFIKKYQKQKKVSLLIYTGTLLGLSTLMWDAFLYLVPIFFIAFFYNKSVKELLWTLIPTTLVFSLKLLFDLIFFNFPLYSLYRFLGTTYLTIFQMGVWAERFTTPSMTTYLIMLVIVSPLFLLLFTKKQFYKNKPELIFIVLSSLLFLRIAQPRYMLILYPIIILLLTRYLSNTQIKLHTILSIILIPILLVPMFTYTTEMENIQDDIQQIADQYPNQNFIVGSESDVALSEVLASLYYGDQINYMISYEEHQAQQTGECYQSYTLTSESSLNNLREAIITFELCPIEKQELEYNYQITNAPLQDQELVKQYTVLYLYKT